jgi:hypothetical protein
MLEGKEFGCERNVLVPDSTFPRPYFVPVTEVKSKLALIISMP